MEKQNNHEYGDSDPDYIDQNTPVDANNIENQSPQELNNGQPTEFGESDPDYIDQNTLVDNDNYARDESPYQYQEEFIEDLKHPKNDFENNIKSENPDQKPILKKEDGNNNSDKANNLNEEKE